MRQVYNIIDLIAEVSGFADLFMIFGAFFLGNFYQSHRLTQALLAHMGPQVHMEKPENRDSARKHSIFHILVELRKRARIKISMWTLLVSSCLPGAYRDRRENRAIKLAEKSIDRIDQALDINRYLKQSDDLRHLMKLFLTKQQRWLFRRQRSRYIPNDSESSDTDTRALDLFMTPPDNALTHKLLNGFFGSNSHDPKHRTRKLT